MCGAVEDVGGAVGAEKPSKSLRLHSPKVTRWLSCIGGPGPGPCLVIVNVRACCCAVAMLLLWLIQLPLTFPLADAILSLWELAPAAAPAAPAAVLLAVG